MATIRPRDILSWTEGELLCGEMRDCRGVFTDSRRTLPDGLFVALRGERFDGHDFVSQAAEAGAAGALVAVSHADRIRESLTAGQFFLVTVADTLAALHQLARGHRARFEGPMIAITGSNGKTTTKDMIAACLSTQAKVLATHRNYNNEIGLPLTLLQLEEDHQVCVVEMATRGLGQISQLAAVAAPDVAVLTNVGPVHLATLGSIANVARAKAELVTALSSSGTAVLNADDPHVVAMQGLTKGRVVTYGATKSAMVRAEAINCWEKGVQFSLWIDDNQVVEAVQVGIPGRHNVSNALAALATCWACGFDVGAAALALADISPSPMRQEIKRLPADILLMNDAYNASPLSMRAALSVFAEVQGCRRVAVLGDMLELGSEHEYWHRQVGKLAVAAGVDYLVSVGEGGRIIASGANEAGLCSKSSIWYADAVAAAAAVERWLQPGDSVLVKASRGLQLEQVASAVGAAARQLEGRRTRNE